MVAYTPLKKAGLVLVVASIFLGIYCFNSFKHRLIFKHISFKAKLLDKYISQLEDLREMLITKNAGLPIEVIIKNQSDTEFIHGYQPNYFEALQKHSQVHTLWLYVPYEDLDDLLPAPRFFDYTGSKYSCDIMTNNETALYPNSLQLLNRTCQSHHSRSQVAFPADRTILSVGLPFLMPEQGFLPTGHTASQPILTFISVIENAIIHPCGVIFSGNISIRPQCCDGTSKVNLIEGAEEAPLYDEVFSLTELCANMYYHLTMEDMSRLGPYMTFLQKHQNIKLHIRKTSFLIRNLDFIGIPESRLVNGTVGARIVYFPAGTTCGRPTVLASQLMASLYHQKAQSRFEDQQRNRIVVIRRTMEDRQFHKHDEIVAMLKTHAEPCGLIVQEFRDDPAPPINTTIETFYNARMIIAPHGAGNTNMVFSQPGTYLIEALWEMEKKKVQTCFRNMAAVLGHHYHGMFKEEGCINMTASFLEEDIKFYLNNLCKIAHE